MTAPLVGTFDEVNGHNSANLHKVLRMAVFVAPYEDATAITTLVDAANNAQIPAAYESVGILDKENAFAATPTITNSEISGYGYAQTLRRDVSARNTAFNFTMLESKRRAFELYYGVDLAAVQATPAGGKNEIVFDEPDRPEAQYWRVLVLGADGDGTRTIYIADFYPRCTISDVAALASSETEARRYGVTMAADLDTATGTSHRQFWAGPGLDDAKIAALGFTRATATV